MPQGPKHLQTGKLSNISVRFSPFAANQLVLAQAENFGIVGAGSVSVVQNEPGKPLQPLCTFPTPDTCFDACFSEAAPDQVLSAGGDGTLKLW